MAFWKRKKNSDFISLNLSGPPEHEPERAPEPQPEPKPAPPPAPVITPPTPVVTEAPKPVVDVPAPVVEAPSPEPVVPASPVVVAPPPAPVTPSPVYSTPEPVSEEEERKGFFARFKTAVAKTRENLTERIEDVFKGKKQIDADTLDQLEEILIGADIGVQTTMTIIEDVRKQVDRQTLKEVDELKHVIKQHLIDILEKATRSRGIASETAIPDDVQPYVMMVVGVNGVGKTTTIGKLAQRIKAEGNSVVICAADTFRAAAADQLAIWAERADVPLIQQKQGTDPAAVLFDSLKAAKSRNADVLIVDTAGRLHNKQNLMAELEKMKRVAQKEVPQAPHEVLLVVDAVTGQNGLSQAREFMKAAPVTGLVLTKLDGTAKGGIAVAIAKELNLPIRYCGVGEKAEDLIVFDPQAYVDGLFE
ncbi:MAG: signal recognition particle-docking protein FtsY [Acidobacteria bacterium]|nr:signal recognition particle-docking protein FtsY [Acidobacteriota bacterium]